MFVPIFPALSATWVLLIMISGVPRQGSEGQVFHLEFHFFWSPRLLEAYRAGIPVAQAKPVILVRNLAGRRGQDESLTTIRMPLCRECAHGGI